MVCIPFFFTLNEPRRVSIMPEIYSWRLLRRRCGGGGDDDDDWSR